MTTMFEFHTALGIDVVSEELLTAQQKESVAKELQRIFEDYEDDIRSDMYAYLAENYDFSSIGDEIFVDGVYSRRLKDITSVGGIA